ncbi:DUF72 domain-containing protein [Roseivirga sp. UBA1976]|uniref:DUF72 domain-containing protein n=1 Tax=Roseivirga sp. UBA1976 TaxID=1947386 RepID=UPI00257F7BE4|nr:DUF72 domain-containing protein [Roseivirga sp. UBA1976]|tara:strand:+ start:6094 stop:6987 length:894 start_codon:yes stop_codon:yes gene_type:complete
MKFGGVANPESIDFTLPPDHEGTLALLSRGEGLQKPRIYVGCAKWNRSDLKGFYPRGTKDELTYYATQFNSIELNATFYNFYSKEQYAAWAQKTPDHFRFFPKVNQMISHMKRLNDVDRYTEEFCESLIGLEEKLGMVFLQLHNNFGPKNWDRLERFLNGFPKEIPLAVEVRHTDWLNQEDVANRFYQLLESKRVSNIITDTAGRRDLLHMRLTTPQVFIRYVGANHESDYTRLDDWLQRIKAWVATGGLTDIYFFVHQNLEKASPLLSAYFIKKLNAELGYELQVPETQSTQSSLF